MGQHLEALILNKIQSTYLEYLLDLPYLLSLIIDCEDEVNNKNNLYYEIFRLPRNRTSYYNEYIYDV